MPFSSFSCRIKLNVLLTWIKDCLRPGKKARVHAVCTALDDSFSLNGTGLLSPNRLFPTVLVLVSDVPWTLLAFEPTSHSPIPCRGRRPTLSLSFLMRSLCFLFSSSSVGRWLWQGLAWREGRWPIHSGSHRRLCSLRTSPYINEMFWPPVEFSYFSIGEFRTWAGCSAVVCGLFDVPEALNKGNEFIGLIQGHMA